MEDLPAFRAALLGWYDAEARRLPWRVSPADRARGVRPDPYRVWLSEVMLQQTTVAHATPYFLAFTARWPTVADLAAAADADLMAAWAGLGYYARARNLLRCARAVAARPDGAFPHTYEGLRALPGVGDYTAAAVAAIAFDHPAAVADGNVERVVSRLYAVESPLPGAKPELKRLAAGLLDPSRPGDWAQATMDLGAVICRPKAPVCPRCPVAAFCAARAGGAPDSYPRRAARARRPRRYGVAYLMTRRGETALVRRPDAGLLGGMLGLPTSEWRARPWAVDEAVAAAPTPAAWREAGRVEHVFTHFALTLLVLQAEVETAPDAVWTRDLAVLPSVFLKAARAGDPPPQSGGGGPPPGLAEGEPEDRLSGGGGRPKHSRPPANSMKFLCDEMLSGLGRWLRSAGHDTAIAPAGAPDADLLAQAVREGRVLLTRDRRLADAASSAVLLTSDTIDDQARELARIAGVDWLSAPFTRCSVDNTLLEPAAPEDLLRMPEESRVLPGPHQVCPACRRVYWPGSHVRRMQARLSQWAARSS